MKLKLKPIHIHWGFVLGKFKAGIVFMGHRAIFGLKHYRRFTKKVT
jgi:hypothetical protein